MWNPEREIVCTGDLVIWAAPNAGNPQKVQRYPGEWARALRAMAAKRPRTLCPGHGGPVVDDPDKIQQMLVETAEFLEAIVADLRAAGLVRSTRGARGGYSLTREPRDICLGDVFRAVDGPLAEVRGLRPHETAYDGVAEHLPTVWVAVRASLRAVLDDTSLADVLSGELPEHVQALAAAPEAWLSR